MYRAIALIILLLVAPVNAGAMDAAAIFDQAGASVVHIYCLDENIDLVGSGTGFFIADGRFVATSKHVVEECDFIGLKTKNDEIQAPLMVAHEHPFMDLALLRVEQPLPPLKISSRTLPTIGEDVLTIGNPFDLESTLSRGIVSGIREAEDMQYIQTTAAISPGSSGGPLLDKDGSVIGVITFYHILGQNLNFAIPSKYLVDMLPASLRTQAMLKEGRSAMPASLPARSTRPDLDATVHGQQWLLNRYAGDVLVIDGSVVNTTSMRQEAVALRVVLLDADGRTLAAKTFIPGTTLTTYQIEHLRPDSIAMRLQGDAAAALNPGAEMSFQSILFDVPDEYKKYRIEVSGSP